ncbi:hypothetical protein CVT24_011649 [Panaeolus cyanescens]|uniref:Rhodopsin domain-containing protein n=1 Tax=Panaeolus cyanescens TaxID=181874 RepID=A0A409YH11_9AGAR|nr:hypothetical protein CVT24_011649 [Panaeolus cyanescens]
MPYISEVTSTALVSTFHALGTGTTLIRLFHRFRIQRLWWDDLWAFMAIILSIIPFALYLNLKDMLASNSFSLISFSILGALIFYTASLWSAKLSVAVTIVRLLRDGAKFRKVAKIATTLIGLGAIALMLQKLFICGTKFDTLPFCRTPAYTGYLELTLDLLSDLWLIMSPLYMLYKMRLPRPHSRLLSAIFACGIFATASNLVHIYYVIKMDVILMVVTSHIQVNVNIITCNLLVLVTFCYRRLHEDQDTIERSETPDPTTNGRGIVATAQSSPKRWSVPTTHITLTDLSSSMMRHSTVNTEGLASSQYNSHQIATGIYTSDMHDSQTSQNLSCSCAAEPKL